MPELPEVQTTVNDLNKRVRGRKVVAVWSDWHKFKAVSKTKNHRIKEVKRLGKNILFYFSDKHILLVHMKMTGHFLIGEWQIKKNRVIPLKPKELKERVNDFIHFILVLDNGRMIGFSDLRKFGKVIFGDQEKIEQLPELKKIGIDALKITFNQFKEQIIKKKKIIYKTLLDQEVISGLGNIYANDVLYKARINPFKMANKLTDEELQFLYKAIGPILKKSLRLRGTSIDDYRDTAGKKGGYSLSRLVYQREGEKCKRCGTIIKRKKVGGRSAHYCPTCQQ